MYCIIVAKCRVEMILVTLTIFSRTPHFKVIILKKPVKSAFSELCFLNQWGFLHQPCMDTLFGDRKELDFNDSDLIFTVATALCNFKV